MSKEEFISEIPEQRLGQVIDGTIEELGKLKQGIASGRFTPEQCIDIENKLRKLYVELANEDLLPDTRLEPKS